MELIWFAVFALLLAGYFALEGFDLGVGLLLPVLGRNRDDRDRMVAAIGPYVLANEVWLVAVAGTLFGVYPLLEGELLPAIYPLVVAMLLAWIVRDAGLWFRRRIGGARWRAFWDLMIVLGSLWLSFGWGLVIYAAATGFDGPLMHPLGLLLGAAVTLLFAWHGRVFLGWRLPGFAGPARTGRALLASGAGRDAGARPARRGDVLHAGAQRAGGHAECAQSHGPAVRTHHGGRASMDMAHFPSRQGRRPEPILLLRRPCTRIYSA
ncbi:cytochrome d ubiquinol oxidase subunit II [Nonomuraea ferruginea]|uniref:cytochrome d ubiquinol oxidase subunit II n=1 Tax=Nonomuraea ferruginea TaxID=46174 RepID=UPI00360D6A9D